MLVPIAAWRVPFDQDLLLVGASADDDRRPERDSALLALIREVLSVKSGEATGMEVETAQEGTFVLADRPGQQEFR